MHTKSIFFITERHPMLGHDINILDINDCQPQWINPIENHTILFINKDLITINTTIIQLKAMDYDEISNGNGLIKYSIKENYEFLYLLNNGELKLNSTPIIGHYILNIQAIDNGQIIQYSTLIQINLLIGNNYTNGSQFYKINSLSTRQRIILLLTIFFSLIFILVFIICISLIMICHYRKHKYLFYRKCHESQLNEPKMIITQNHSIDSNSNSSKLSLV